MGWVELPEVSKENDAILRKMKKIKLYADEDVEEHIVELLRKVGFNYPERQRSWI